MKGQKICMNKSFVIIAGIVAVLLLVILGTNALMGRQYGSNTRASGVLTCPPEPPSVKPYEYRLADLKTCVRMQGKAFNGYCGNRVMSSTFCCSNPMAAECQTPDSDPPAAKPAAAASGTCNIKSESACDELEAKGKCEPGSCQVCAETPSSSIDELCFHVSGWVPPDEAMFPGSTVNVKNMKEVCRINPDQRCFNLPGWKPDEDARFPGTSVSVKMKRQACDVSPEDLCFHVPGWVPPDDAVFPGSGLTVKAMKELCRINPDKRCFNLPGWKPEENVTFPGTTVSVKLKRQACSPVATAWSCTPVKEEQNPTAPPAQSTDTSGGVQQGPKYGPEEANCDKEWWCHGVCAEKEIRDMFGNDSAKWRNERAAAVGQC